MTVQYKVYVIQFTSPYILIANVMTWVMAKLNQNYCKQIIGDSKWLDHPDNREKELRTMLRLTVHRISPSKEIRNILNKYRYAISYNHCVKYRNFTQFPGVEITVFYAVNAVRLQKDFIR